MKLMGTDRLKVAEAKLKAAEAKLKGIVEEVMQKERLGNGLKMPEAWIIEAVLKRVPPPPLELPPAHRSFYVRAIEWKVSCVVREVLCTGERA